MAEKKRYTFRFSDKTGEDIKRLAEQSRRSQSNLLEVIVEQEVCRRVTKDAGVVLHERSEDDVLLQHG